MNCIHCNGTGRCNACHGSGKMGMLDCIHCNGTGKCNFCNGTGGMGGTSGGNFGSRGSSGFNNNRNFARNPGSFNTSNQNNFARNPGSFNTSNQNNFARNPGSFGTSNFGPRDGFPAEEREDTFARSRRLTKEAIDKLYSKNPMDLQDAIETLNSHECSFDRKSAYQPAIEVYFDAKDTHVKAGLVGIIASYANNPPDYKVMRIFEDAISSPDFSLQYAGIRGMSKNPQNDRIVIPKIQEIYNRPEVNTFVKGSLLRWLAMNPRLATNLLGLIAGELNNPSKSIQKNAESAIGNLLKKNVNVVGFLTDLVVKGDSTEKLNACIGLGKLGKNATGSVNALASALSDEDPSVRAKAAWALVQMKKSAAPAEDALRKATEDESPAVSKMALKALKNIKKLSKEQKEKIKGMEKEEEQMKKWVAKYKNYFAPKSEEKDENAPQVKNRFFMSHALEDFKWVEKAMKVIESWPGCEVWTCERDIPVGGDWMESIYDGLDNCNWYVLFWSEFAEQSAYTNDEMKEAKSRNVTTGTPKITIVNLGMPEWPKYVKTNQGSKVLNDFDLENWLNLLKTQVKF